jgi:hypothetical protein
MARKTSETAFFGVFCISYPISGQTQSGHVLCKGLNSRTSALVKRRFQCHNRASTLLCWRINPEKYPEKSLKVNPNLGMAKSPDIPIENSCHFSFETLPGSYLQHSGDAAKHWRGRGGPEGQGCEL